MADVIREEDDELVIVEPGAEPEAQEDDAPAGEADEHDDEDDADDERMGTSEDDSEDEIVDKNKKNRETRAKRRQVQKQAKERTQRELELLRQQNAELMRRMQAVEGNTLSQNAATIDARMNEALNEIKQAEMIIAKAVEAGNGEDVAVAMRMRDEAKQRADQFYNAKQRVEQVAQQAQQPQSDPRVVDYARQWMDANDWYDPTGRDEDSMITKAVDNALAAEGWNPATPDYWQELTRRVSARLNAGEDAADAAPRTPRRKAPPTGNTREHAPPSTKNEVVVTAERKQAMIDAGVWDDPVARTRYLKAYQAYDRENAAR
ncbi:MAG: hypothetical protein ACR2JI_16370 [Mycobacterium sp.]